MLTENGGRVASALASSVAAGWNSLTGTNGYKRLTCGGQRSIWRSNWARSAWIASCCAIGGIQHKAEVCTFTFLVAKAMAGRRGLSGLSGGVRRRSAEVALVSARLRRGRVVPKVEKASAPPHTSILPRDVQSYRSVPTRGGGVTKYGTVSTVLYPVVGRGERSTPGLRLFLWLLSRSRFSCGFVSLGLGGWL